MKHSSINLSGKEVVCGGDCVDVAGEVEVELVHGDHLSRRGIYFGQKNHKKIFNLNLYIKKNILHMNLNLLNEL